MGDRRDLGVAEIERARSAAAGRRALALENSTLAASQLAEEQIVHGREITPTEIVAALDEVRDEEVAEVAAAVIGPPSIACVGPHSANEFAG